MNERPLKIAAFGLTKEIETLLDCAFAMKEVFAVAGVADLDPERAGAAARRFECTAYDDVRRMLVQTGPKIFLAGGPTYQCAEWISLALEKQCTVFKTAPAGLTFEQASEWIRTAHRQGRYFLVLEPQRFHPLLQLFGEIADREDVNYWHLISLVCRVPQPLSEPQDRWRFDPSLAGGGVLIQNTYWLMDCLLLHFGLPQQVYMQRCSQAPDRQQRMSTTEDTAAAVMRFSDSLIAEISASRTLGPPGEYLRVCGKERFVTLEREQLTICGYDGRVLERRQICAEPSAWAQRFLEMYLRHLENPQQPLFPPPEADVRTMAVLEAAYLSSKTGMPESPSRILEVGGFKPDGLW
ncbi:MAG TPA: Gfo/Idh/MocA family oxidoreductase [Anaerohalosphaeraceae bacterium]|nr:Gfo/Idh/MocA family oxidoreductase [Anaerohalosphaeraceae bacterium]